MEKIYIFCPADQAGYLDLLVNIGPKLDDAGISFHICRPGEDIPGYILQDKGVME